VEDYKKHIYWVESFENQEDWFVVGLDQYVAEKFFCDYEGYDLDLVSSEIICVAEFEDEDESIEEAYFPSDEMLIKNGFEVITEDEPRIFWRAGRKFCQGNIIQKMIVQKSNKKAGVYIVEVRDSGLYKIGITKDINKRLSQLQTSNPYEFYLIDFFISIKSRELEKLLHEKFRLNRYKREWFKLNQNELMEACKFASSFIDRPFSNNSSDKIEQIETESDKMERLLEKNDLPF
jgi:hypothetical protein